MIEIETGWIRLYRKLLEDTLWRKSTNEQKIILITLLLMVNHDGQEWEWKGEKFRAEPGQTVTSIDSIISSCGGGITTQNVRSALKRFEKLGFLTNESTKTGRLITVANWAKYQPPKDKGNKEPNKEVTKSQQRGNKDLTPNKNDKNDKNNIYAQQAEQLWSLYPNKQGKATAIKKIPKLIEQYGYEKIEACIKRYTEEVKGRDKKYIKHGSTFFNGGYMDYLDENISEPSSERGELYFDQYSDMYYYISNGNRVYVDEEANR